MSEQPMTITAFGQTMTLYQWAQEMGIAESTLQSRIRRNGWTPEKALSTSSEHSLAQKRAEAQERMRMARRMYRQGMSRAEIAERLQCSRRTVSEYLLDNGLSARWERRERQRRVWAMYQGGMSGLKIAKHLELSESTVYRDLKAVQDDPSTLMVDKAGHCDCGESATICVQVKIRQSAKEVLNLCPSCYDLFIETEVVQ
jgi:transposase